MIDNQQYDVIGEGFADQFDNWQFQFYVEVHDPDFRDADHSDYCLFRVKVCPARDIARRLADKCCLMIDVDWRYR